MFGTGVAAAHAGVPLFAVRENMPFIRLTFNRRVSFGGDTVLNLVTVRFLAAGRVIKNQ